MNARSFKTKRGGNDNSLFSITQLFACERELSGTMRHTCFLNKLWQGNLKMHSAVIGGAHMMKLQNLFGGYGVNATSQQAGDVNTEALIAKLKTTVGGTMNVTDAERATLIRALEWCVRNDINKKSQG